jgi:hypothetical protein
MTAPVTTPCPLPRGNGQHPRTVLATSAVPRSRSPELLREKALEAHWIRDLIRVSWIAEPLLYRSFCRPSSQPTFRPHRVLAVATTLATDLSSSGLFRKSHLRCVRFLQSSQIMVSILQQGPVHMGWARKEILTQTNYRARCMRIVTQNLPRRVAGRSLLIKEQGSCFDEISGEGSVGRPL